MNNEHTSLPPSLSPSLTHSLAAGAAPAADADAAQGRHTRRTTASLRLYFASRPSAGHKHHPRSHAPPACLIPFARCIAVCIVIAGIVISPCAVVRPDCRCRHSCGYCWLCAPWDGLQKKPA
jgi:hypothetical protein